MTMHYYARHSNRSGTVIEMAPAFSTITIGHLTKHQPIGHYHLTVSQEAVVVECGIISCPEEAQQLSAAVTTATMLLGHLRNPMLHNALPRTPTPYKETPCPPLSSPQ